MGELSTLFAPERVAVIGASETEGTVGYAITKNLRDEFEGTVVPVNPNREHVLGLPCHETVADTEDVDVAIVVVPPEIAVGVVEEAGRAGVENVVVITAGFSESGGEGSRRERELVAVAEDYDLNLVGPNSLGIMRTAVSLNATFGPKSARPGNISFMSQSGAFITAVLDWATDRNIGFRDVVSLGNKAVLSESNFIREWGDDEGTDVILAYLEDIGDGQSFIQTAREVTDETPIVAVKSGRTDAGASAAASHTGAIAGSDAAYEAGLEQAGVLRVDSVQELFDAAEILSGQQLPVSDGVAIVTNAGGPGVMATDAVGDSSLNLATLTDDTLSRLQERLPEEANIHNPIDIIGDAPLDRFEETIDIVLDDDNVGMAVVLSCPVSVLSFEELAEVTVEQQRTHGKPVAATLMGGDSTQTATEILSEAGIPTYFDPERAVQSLDALSQYATISDRTYAQPPEFDIDRERIRERLDSAIEAGRTQLGVESMDLLEACGIPTPRGETVDSPREAQALAEDIGGDVVMKIVSPDISHKSDIGGVEVGVPTEDVADAYEDLVVRARNYQPDATILGVQVQEMVDIDTGTETIVGVTRDPQFGPLVMFGLGGIFVEVMEDTSFRVAPVAEPEIREMVDEVTSSPLLYGARGREPADIDALVDVVGRISQLVTEFPEITELDINPAVALPDGVAAIDLRLTLDAEARQTQDQP
jgi:acetyltransferase